MPLVGCFTGNGVSVVFTPDAGGATAAANVLFAAAPKASVGEVTMELETLEAVAVSDPVNSFTRKCPADTINISTMAVTMYFDPDMDVTKLIGQTGVIERIEPLLTGQSTPAKWSGDGFIASCGLPQEATNQLSQVDVVFQWYGTAPPGKADLTHTASAA
jgi:hypothetical protein